MKGADSEEFARALKLGATCKGQPRTKALERDAQAEVRNLGEDVMRVDGRDVRRVVDDLRRGSRSVLVVGVEGGALRRGSRSVLVVRVEGRASTGGLG